MHYTARPQRISIYIQMKEEGWEECDKYYMDQYVSGTDKKRRYFRKEKL